MSQTNLLSHVGPEALSQANLSSQVGPEAMFQANLSSQVGPEVMSQTNLLSHVGPEALFQANLSSQVWPEAKADSVAPASEVVCSSVKGSLVCSNLLVETPKPMTTATGMHSRLAELGRPEAVGTIRATM
jgi:hypothetical protein